MGVSCKLTAMFALVHAHDQRLSIAGLVYRPTPRLLQLLGAETLEEARVRLRVAADQRSQMEPAAGIEPAVEYQAGSKGATK